MKRALPFAIIILLVLLFAGCNVFEGLIPSLDPIVGTWTVSKMLMTSGSDGSWHDASYFGVSGTTTVAGDGSWSGSFTQSATTTAVAGSWQNDSGVYTLICNTAGYSGITTITLTSNNKTAYVVASSGVQEQLTKQ